MTFKNNKIKFQKGFTLIELLVVIAIIGVLASVVLASLNSARTKGQIAAIKSNLKNIIPQAELAYDVPGNYSAVCSDPKVASILAAIINDGGAASCVDTLDNTRWGVSAKLNSDSTQNFAVDSSGVFTWDTANKTASNWDTANINCAASGGHLPTPEQLQALYFVYGSTVPANLTSTVYWSGVTVPTNSNNAYRFNMSNGAFFNDPKTTVYAVRCVH